LKSHGGGVGRRSSGEDVIDDQDGLPVPGRLLAYGTGLAAEGIRLVQSAHGPVQVVLAQGGASSPQRLDFRQAKPLADQLGQGIAPPLLPAGNRHDPAVALEFGRQGLAQTPGQAAQRSWLGVGSLAEQQLAQGPLVVPQAPPRQRPLPLESAGG